MEYLDGVTLEKLLKKRPNERISYKECLPLVIPVINALREIHAAGITHRDVSPENVIIAKIRCCQAPVDFPVRPKRSAL